jgi:hypothetical protein
VIARPSQLADATPQGSVKRFGSWAASLPGRVRSTRPHFLVAFLRSRTEHLLDVMLVDVRAGSSVVIGMLFAMIALGALVAFLTR